MELEIKHVAPYFPYGLKVRHRIYNQWDEQWDEQDDEIESISNEYVTFKKGCDWYFGGENYCDFNPILRPLFDINWQDFIDENPRIMSDAILDFIDYFESDGANYDVAILTAPYPVIEWCFKNKFDVFSLIKSNLAIDVNTLDVK